LLDHRILIIPCHKTQDLAEQKDKIAVYVDLETLSLTPELFAVEFVGTIFYHWQGKADDYRQCMKLDFLLRDSSLSQPCVARLKNIENELQKIKPNQRFLIEESFAFLTDLAKVSDKQFVVALDNFEHILDLNNFSQVKDILSIVDFKQRDIQFVVASSSIHRFHDLAGFDVLVIPAFSPKESRELIESLGVGSGITDVQELSHNAPFIIQLLCSDIEGDVKKAFLSHLSF